MGEFLRRRSQRRAAAALLWYFEEWRLTEARKRGGCDHSDGGHECWALVRIKPVSGALGRASQPAVSPKNRESDARCADAFVHLSWRACGSRGEAEQFANFARLTANPRPTDQKGESSPGFCKLRSIHEVNDGLRRFLSISHPES